jgi:hypothetical protein
MKKPFMKDIVRALRIWRATRLIIKASRILRRYQYFQKAKNMLITMEKVCREEKQRSNHV